MEYIECPFCPTQLPSKALFCSQCGNSVKCIECKEPLEKNAKACIYCGTKTDGQSDDTKVAHPNHNVFEFDEGPRHRKFRAVFSDEVGNSLGQALGIALTGRSLNIPRMNTKKVTSDFEAPGELFVKAASESGEIPSDLAELQEGTQVVDVTSAEHPIRNIFSTINGEIILSETRLKAKGKLDFAQRLTYLLMLYYKLSKVDQVAKADVVSFLTKLNIYDSHWGSWIKGNTKDFYHSQDDFISLIKPGSDMASLFLKEALDETIENIWDLNNAAKNKKDYNSDVSKVKKAIAEYKLVSDLNLYPKGKESLHDFFQSYKAASAYDRNLIFVYYMQEVLKIDEITTDHIYTCYRTLKDIIPKTPEALLQSMAETIKVKGYVMKDGNNYKLTTPGINHLEQKLKNKQ